MSSGILLSEEAKGLFTEMKVQKKGAEADDRIRLATFRINEGESEIVVEEIYREKDLAGVQDVYKLFQEVMKAGECRYILYDCHYETKESSKKEELVFLMWAPDGSCIKSKMKYASSKNAITKCFTGIKHCLQMNDCSDHDKHCFAETIGKTHKVISLEGHPLYVCDHGGHEQEQEQQHAGHH